MNLDVNTMTFQGAWTPRPGGRDDGAGGSLGASEPGAALLDRDVASLAALRGVVRPLTLQERRQMVGQCVLLAETVYADPALRGSAGAEPAQALRRILGRLAAVCDDRALVRDVLEVFGRFSRLRAALELPDPQRGFTAFLPLTVACWGDGDAPRYVVTNVSGAHRRGGFGPGAELTHWNGAPIAAVLERLEADTVAPGPWARRRQALDRLTLRPLAFLPPPDEDWVELSCRRDGRTLRVRLPWQVIGPELDAAPDAGPPAALAMDLVASRIRLARERLFRPERVRRERELAPRRDREAPAFPDVWEAGFTWFPRQLGYDAVESPVGPVGYLRIRSLEVDDVPLFLAEVRRILTLLPQHGVIVDVRGNPGGAVAAGAGVLQLFSDRRVAPPRLPLSRAELARLAAQGVEIPAGWTAVPSAKDRGIEAIGRVYPGRALLLTDSLCYGAAELLAAGWRDHRVGAIVGTDPATGGGGANLWTHELLLSFGRERATGSPFQHGPRVAALHVVVPYGGADGSGAPRVVPDLVRRRTRADVLSGDRDLIAFAARQLAAEKAPRAAYARAARRRMRRGRAPRRAR